MAAVLMPRAPRAGGVVATEETCNAEPIATQSKSVLQRDKMSGKKVATLEKDITGTDKS
eukprot:CAMPEP_0179159480 /NCGR_PEP_ID=MMETSP0796-20121207/77897_1 /TAXON_ID=73915 /ORGANISM="Pyrodinium bahamense, Strain pbaha01" /LENGTH=58 /DNA_ID=CAMNT_0020861283 /DNA_START=29 /DNA_END=205 /DNA_ORIENTATION=+